MENEKLSVEMLENFIREKNVRALRDLFESTQFADIADVVDQLDDVKQIVFIFRTVNSEYTAELFSYMKPETQEKLVNLFTDHDLMVLIANSYTDDIVDFLTEMPANLVSRILKVSDKATRADINHLLNYQEHTAGAIMTTEYVILFNTYTVEEALSAIRKIGREAETVYTNFVIDSKRNLVGTIDLDDLIFSEPKDLISNVMNTDFKTVDVFTDQEEVARAFKRYDLNAMPVLNKDRRLVGIVTVDDIIDVIEEEASEDMAKMAAVTPLSDSYIRSSVWSLAKKCVPWLIILLVLGVGASVVLNLFEETIGAVPILAAFVPVLMDGGGNSGNQTTVLVTRSLALKEITPKDFLKVVWKEFRVGLLVALGVASFAFLWVFFELSVGILHYATVDGLAGWAWFGAVARIAGLVSFTLGSAVVVSKVIGSMLPLATAAVGLDPAVVSSPLLTTIVDVVSLVLYFLASSQIFHLI